MAYGIPEWLDGPDMCDPKDPTKPNIGTDKRRKSTGSSSYSISMPSICIPAVENPEALAANWRRLKDTAFRRFAPLGEGEKIGVREIKRRLGEIRGAAKPVGYEIRPYSRMSASEAWEYLQELKRDLRQR